MQVKAFGYLVELAQSGSFYRAAKNLGISQQGLNKAIAALEEELGAKLVERSAAGTRLTRTGETVLQYAREINDQYTLLLQQLFAARPREAEAKNRVTVHVSYYSAQIASADIQYVSMLTKNLIYVEDPFDKLVRFAELSDGTDLVFTDVHQHTLGEIRANKKIRFEPMVSTRYGFLWKDGSPLAAEEMLHRETVAKHPVAVNSSRETTQMLDRLFADTPLQDIRLGSTSTKLLLEYIQTSADTACLSDSFGYYLSCKYSGDIMSGLHFTPLSTPESRAYLGFLLPADAPIAPEARKVIDALRRYLHIKCPDYLRNNPIAQ